MYCGIPKWQKVDAFLGKRVASDRENRLLQSVLWDYGWQFRGCLANHDGIRTGMIVVVSLLSPATLLRLSRSK